MGIFRAAVERLSRGKVLKAHINVQSKSIPIMVSPDAQLKYLKLGRRAFDQDLIEIAEAYLNETSHVWDIGANVGVFTFASAYIAKKGTVLSVEPDTWLVELLRTTAGFDEYAKTDVNIVPVAVSNKNGVASFMVASRGRASNALESAGGRSQMGGVRELQCVPTMTLDTLLDSFNVPNFVKIDIEGAELMALEGAKSLINDARPIFYIEVGLDVSEKVLRLFYEANYIAINPRGEVLTNVCAPNTFFIPQEKHVS